MKNYTTNEIENLKEKILRTIQPKLNWEETKKSKQTNYHKED